MDTKVLVIVLIFLVIFGGGWWGQRSGDWRGPGGLIGVVLFVVLLLWALGKL